MKNCFFENELILHLLTQKNLKKLFGLECVASEILINKLRLDNLVFDKENNKLVIIEYKNRFCRNVLNQAQDYYNLVSKNPEEILKRLENSENIDFENPLVMIISPKFSDEQISKAKPNFELWQVCLHDNLTVEYKKLKSNETVCLNVTEDDLKLTEDDLLRNKLEEIRQLYEALKKCVKDEFKDVKCKILVDEISFKINGKIICNVKFLKKSFNVYFYAQNLVDEKDKLRDISDISTGGKASYEYKIKSKDDLDYFMELFKQTYD